MTITVVPVEGSPKWEPNDQEAVLIKKGSQALLGLAPHFDDDDQRSVVIEWNGVRLATIGEPNDEGRASHALYSSGLRSLIWMGEALDSDLTSAEHHYLVPMKEELAEVIAASFEIHRIEGQLVSALTTLVAT